MYNTITVEATYIYIRYAIYILPKISECLWLIDGSVYICMQIRETVIHTLYVMVSRGTRWVRWFRDWGTQFVTHSWLGLGSDLVGARVNHYIKLWTVAEKGPRRQGEVASSEIIAGNSVDYWGNRENYFSAAFRWVAMRIYSQGKIKWPLETTL